MTIQNKKEKCWDCEHGKFINGKCQMHDTIKDTKKIFKVGVWEEQGGYIYVKAETPDEAENIAREHIEEYGFDKSDIPGVETVKVTHRDAEVLAGDITEYIE